MKNSRHLQAYGLVAIISALALWSDSPRKVLAQNTPSGRTYRIFPGITFPNFPGTGGRQTPGSTPSPSTPAKPVMPLVEVPTPGLQTGSTNPTRTTQRRRTTIEQQAPPAKPRTRRPRRTKPAA